MCLLRKSKNPLSGDLCFSGGGNRIRTCGDITATHPFQGCAFDHSAIPPKTTLVNYLKFFCISRRMFDEHLGTFSQKRKILSLRETFPPRRILAMTHGSYFVCFANPTLFGDSGRRGLNILQYARYSGLFYPGVGGF